MECGDRTTNTPSGNRGHLCSKCGWVFPNPHPSARHRRAHKKVCGTIQVNDCKTLIDGSENMEKTEEMAVSSSRSITGFGSESIRSNRSEDDVFSDAVMEFPDNSSGVSDSTEVQDSLVYTDADLRSILHDCDNCTQNISDELKHDNKDAEMNICDRIEMNLVGEVNGDGDDGRSMVIKLSESMLSLPEFGDGMDDSINKVEEVEMDNGSSESASSTVANSISNVEDDSNAHNHAICEHKALDSVEDSLNGKVNCNGAQLEKTEASNMEEMLIDDEKVNLDEYHGRSMVETLSESILSVTEFEDGMDNKVETERENTNVQMKLLQNSEATHELMAVGKSASSVVRNPISGVVNTHNHTTCSDQASDFVDDNLIKKVNGNGAQLENTKASNVGELEDDGDGEVNTHDHTICVYKDSDSVEDSSTEKVYGNGAQLEKTEVSDVEELESASSVVTNGSVVHELDTHDRTICLQKDSDLTDNIPTEGGNGNGAQLEKSKASSAEELVSASLVVTNSVSSVNDVVHTHDHTNCVHKTSDPVDDSLSEAIKGNGAQLEKVMALNVEELGNGGDQVPDDECFGKVDIGLISDNDDISDLTQNAPYTSDEDHSINEKNGTASASTDLQAVLFSQTDSLECNWGSISDAPTATETRSQPSQESSYKPEPRSGKSLEKKAEKADQDWSTGEQHMPLKSYLGESLSRGKNNNPQKETINTVMSSKEWDSPARYPSKIKTQKGKVRRRPYWAPFICCSSVQTS